MPIKSSFSNYQRYLKGDLSGGLLAAIIGLPMGLAFGVQSGLGPQAGIYTAIILGFVASVFGGTRTLISDPTGPMTVVAATVVSMGLATAGSLENALPLIVGTFVLAGVFEFVFGLLDLGRFVKYMPYPVLSGFMAGIGIIIIAVQLFPLLGYDSPKGFLTIITNLGTPLREINLHALGLGGLTLAIIYGLPLLTKKVPAILVALIVVTLLSVGLGLEVPLIGEIPTALPSFQIQQLGALTWDDFSHIIRPALLLGGLGVIDSLLTSIVADSMTKTSHNTRMTVIGQGVGNIVTALFGGIPGAGATMGTVTNIKGGARTQLSGIFKGLILLIIVVGIADLVEYVPMAVLAGILISIGASIIDYKGIWMLLRVPKQDTAVWLLVLAVTLFNNLLNAVAAGFVLSAILFIGRMVTSMEKRQQSVSLKTLLKNKNLSENLATQISVLQLHGPLFFGFADKFRAHCESIQDVIAIIVYMGDVPFLDQSGIVTLKTVVQDWHDRGIQVYFTDVDPEIMNSFLRVELVPGLVRRDCCFPSVERCVENIAEKIAASPEGMGYEEILIEDRLLGNREE